MRRPIIVSCLALAAVASLATASFAYMKDGTATGVVVTVGDDRVVVQVDEGGQNTFEAENVKKGEDWVRNEDQIVFMKTLKRGDRVRVEWGEDHAGHRYAKAIKKLDADRKPAAVEDGQGTDDPLQAMIGEVKAYRQEIAALRRLVTEALEKKPAAPEGVQEQLRAMLDEVKAYRQEVAALRRMLTEALEKKR